MSLNDWLAAKHAAGPPKFPKDATAAQKAAAVVIDGLMRPELLRHLLPVFEGSAWKDIYGLRGKESAVSIDQYDAASPEERIYHHAALVDRSAGSPGSIAWLFFAKFFKSTEFMNFVNSASGVEATHFQGYRCHIMQRHHYFRPHRDIGRRRALCGVFYVGDGWRPGYGGEFEMLRGGETIDLVSPLANRLLLFRPRLASQHAVRQMTSEAGDWKRKSISLWWADGPPGVTTSEGLSADTGST